jgi:hypothetical protein
MPVGEGVPAQEVPGDERKVRERQGVRVLGVHPAEGLAHLADLHQEAAGQCRERDVALLDPDLLGPESEEEVGAGVRVDDGLEGKLRLLQAQRGLPAAGRRAGHRHEVPDGGDVGVEHLGRGSRRPVDGEGGGSSFRRRARRDSGGRGWPGRRLGSLRRRRGRGLVRRTRAFEGADPRLDRRHPGAVLLAQGVELAAEPGEILARRGRRLLGGAGAGGNEQETDADQHQGRCGRRPSTHASLEVALPELVDAGARHPH